MYLLVLVSATIDVNWCNSDVAFPLEGEVASLDIWSKVGSSHAHPESILPLLGAPLRMAMAFGAGQRPETQTAVQQQQLQCCYCSSVMPGLPSQPSWQGWTVTLDLAQGFSGERGG